MVLLVEKLTNLLKFHSKLDNHHHDSEALSASLQAFRSDISDCLIDRLLRGSGLMSLERVHHFLEMIKLMNNKAFATLVASLDYPISKWEASTVEEYLEYSLNCLELLNCVSSCLSHLSQDRLELSHAVSRVEESLFSATRNLKKIQNKDPGKHFKLDGLKPGEERHCTGKELVIHQALVVMKSIAMWIFGFIISGLCSDVKPFCEIKTLAGRFDDDSLLKSMDSEVSKEIMEKQGELKEVKDVNDAADALAEAIGSRNVNSVAMEMKRRLQKMEKLLQGIEQETDNLFAEILAARDNLLDSIRSTGTSSSN